MTLGFHAMTVLIVDALVLLSHDIDSCSGHAACADIPLQQCVQP